MSFFQNRYLQESQVGPVYPAGGGPEPMADGVIGEEKDVALKNGQACELG